MLLRRVEEKRGETAVPARSSAVKVQVRSVLAGAADRVAASRALPHAPWRHRSAVSRRSRRAQSAEQRPGVARLEVVELDVQAVVARPRPSMAVRTLARCRGPTVLPLLEGPCPPRSTGISARNDAARRAARFTARGDPHTPASRMYQARRPALRVDKGAHANKERGRGAPSPAGRTCGAARQGSSATTGVYRWMPW